MLCGGLPCLPALVQALNDLTDRGTEGTGVGLDSERGCLACGHDVAHLNNLTGPVAVENTGSCSPGTLFLFHLLCVLRRRTESQASTCAAVSPWPRSPLPSSLSLLLSPLFSLLPAPFFLLRLRFSPRSPTPPGRQARNSQHGVTNRVRGAQGAHQAPFDAQEAVPSRRPLATLPQRRLHRLVRIHGRRIP